MYENYEDAIVPGKLLWPLSKTRTPEHKREEARFGRQRDAGVGNWKSRDRLTVHQAIRRLAPEISRFDGTDMRVSSDIATRKSDGMPISSAREPEDPGVAVYFRLNGKPKVLACDRFKRLADNIAAVAAHIDKIRAIDRYGVLELDEVMPDYKALPATVTPAPSWQSVLGVGRGASLEQVTAAYKAKIRAVHPDRNDAPNAEEQFALVRGAYKQAKAELEGAA